MDTRRLQTILRCRLAGRGGAFIHGVVPFAHAGICLLTRMEFAGEVAGKRQSAVILPAFHHIKLRRALFPDPFQP